MTDDIKSPCVTCRHEKICDATDVCLAAKYFVRTGNPITPPRRYPGTQMEKQEKPATRLAPKPLINKEMQAFTNVHLQVLAGLEPAMEKK